MTLKVSARIKIALISFLGVASALLVFYLLNQFLLHLSVSIWLVLFSVWLFLTVSTLTIFFAGNAKTVAGVFFVQGLMPLVFFYTFLYPKPSLIFIGGVFLLILFWITGALNSFRDLKNGVTINFFVTTHRLLPKVVLGLLIFVAALSYLYFFQLNNFSEDAARKLFDRSMASAEPLLQIWFPDVTFDMNINTAISKISEVQLKRSQLDLLQQGIDINKISLADRQALLNETNAKITRIFENLAGEIRPDQTFGDTLFNALKTRILALSALAQAFLEVGIIVVLFFVLKALAFLLYIPAQVAAFVLFKALLVLGFAEIGLENTQREVIVLS